MKEQQNDRSQSQRGGQQGNQRNDQRNDQRDKRAAQPGTSGHDAAAQSEQRLDQEERSLVGNTAEDRNLTGSTTYVTLPDQKGDENTGRDQRKASGNQGGNQGGSQQSSGRSGSQRSTSSHSTNDRDTPR